MKTVMMMVVLLLWGAQSADAQLSSTVKSGRAFRLFSGPNQVQGIATSVNDTMLAFDASGSLKAIHVASIDSLQLRTSKARGTAVKGAIFGGLVGGVLTAFASRGNCDGDACGRAWLVGGAVGLPVGAALGGGIGFLFGSISRSWNTVYRR